VFGSAAGTSGSASRLITRVSAARPGALRRKQIEDEDAPGMNSPEGYLLFPLRNKDRARFPAADLPRFQLMIHWRGEPALWEDIRALISVLGHLGSLGFRSRRAMGALSVAGVPDLAASLRRFGRPEGVTIHQLPAHDMRDAIRSLAVWLRGWRSYGRSQDRDRGTGPQPNSPDWPGFKYAKSDHDAPFGGATQTYRPALGLPIIQRFTTGRKFDWNRPQGGGSAKGRFASPVILRPHRGTDGTWRALVIFVEARKWDSRNQVEVSDGVLRRRLPVSLDLYNAMKADPRLSQFP